MKLNVVSTLPTSTTNMTGFFAIVRGCSLPERIADRRGDDLRIPDGDCLCVCH